ncbi:GNAT family N-acetyltransferase [Butyrivibrio sp. AE2032]|uniref:GNAT family N-acetyltransferase n=1 Tax=Butyrivibrio sp. AE2032 TaxID=1458463 RepID=UPI000553D070|nr:GNAT family N-acetyltransferase [Butyrivibrio sp. AE2032]
MKISYVYLDEKNRIYFERVFPKEIELAPFRVAVGVIDEERRVLGAVSYILLNYEYSLDWIYVEPQVRRQGIGTQLVQETFRCMMHTGDLFPLSAQFEYSDEDNVLHTFFLSMKHMITTYSHERYYVTKDDIKKAEGLRYNSKNEVEAELFFDKPEAEQKKVLNMLMREQTYEVADYERWKESCVPELCKCIYVKNNLVDLIFMQKNPDGNLELSYLYGKYPKGLFELLAETVRDLENHFPGVKITFDAMTDDSKKLAEHLFPTAKKAHVYEAEF